MFLHVDLFYFLVFMLCKVHCLELKKKMTKKWFLYIYLLYHILHIAMKHVGKQGKSLGCRMPGLVIRFCVCLKFANSPPLEIESSPSE